MRDYKKEFGKDTYPFRPEDPTELVAGYLYMSKSISRELVEELVEFFVEKFQLKRLEAPSYCWEEHFRELRCFSKNDKHMSEAKRIFLKDLTEAACNYQYSDDCGKFFYNAWNCACMSFMMSD